MNIQLLEINSKDSYNREEIKDKVQAQMKKDRDLIDKASNAFVSFVRYYKEHSL